MSDIRDRLRVKPGHKVDLSVLDPDGGSYFDTKEDGLAHLKESDAAIAELQDRLYAERSRALLVILQGMDTSGKDGTTAAVFKSTGPVGVTVTAFQKPSETELAHDFLWRVHTACPRRGTIGVFNRSHYEDVLIGRVRKLAPYDVIKHRYDQINAFEDLIASSTRIVKIMLHISKDEQAKRLQSRLDKSHKNWKFDPNDLTERKKWKDYMASYELMLQRCSTDVAPWYVVPSDRKWARNALVGEIVRRTLEDMNPHYPKPDWSPDDFKVE